MKSKNIKVEAGEFIVYENGDVINAKTKNKLKHYENGVGYYRVGLYCGNNKHKSYYIHRLLAMAFIPNPENKQFINHIDGNPKNNNLSNLEWCTKSENNLHAYKTGLKIAAPSIGEKNGNSVLNNEIVKKIKLLYAEGKRQFEIVKETNVDKYKVSNIVRNKIWKHINI